jgi:hypothetical protein
MFLFSIDKQILFRDVHSGFHPVHNVVIKNITNKQTEVHKKRALGDCL